MIYIAILHYHNGDPVSFAFTRREHAVAFVRQKMHEGLDEDGIRERIEEGDDCDFIQDTVSNDVAYVQEVEIDEEAPAPESKDE